MLLEKLLRDSIACVFFSCPRHWFADIALYMLKTSSIPTHLGAVEICII